MHPPDWLNVLRAADALLQQCESLVSDLPDVVYTSESTVLPGGTVGKHLRHVTDHYHAIVAASSGSEPVDYDHRLRDVPMEVDRAHALRTLAALRASIAQLAPMGHASPVSVRVMLAGDGCCATLGTTLGRELAFATHHAVHHQAMMRAIAGEFGVDISPDFGKAPSTIHHELSTKR
ncbi:MAG TPA: hypothetical protein VK157_09545 [Phycisphaerales bacterium]|nr:hypothetical protein [Phycisphaerales bacterium]